MNEFKTMHLFAGHGGGLLADLILGHTPIVAVEWDRYACRVLRERAADGWFPGLRVWEGDVRMFDPSEYAGKVDCIHAGFPCQDISVAGKQAGVGTETRSGLYREVLRIASVVRPKQLFLENVSAIVNNGLGTVLADLASLGYDSEWLCLRASDCGANHQRDRWWLLASNTNTMCERLEGGGKTGNLETQTGPGFARSHGATIELDADVSNTECQRLQGQGEYVNAINSAQGSDWEATEFKHGGSSDFWSIESNVGRVANGVPHRVHRLKGLGNAQVPLQAAVAWKLLGGC